jgi:hypothetical protein
MSQPEERTERLPEERDEDRVGTTTRRAAPIDEVVAGEINAALPEDVGVSERRRQMGENTPQEYQQLSREELEKLAGEELPERAAMSLINANIAIPVNAAVAANVLSDGAVAYADAAQQTPIDQSN